MLRGRSLAVLVRPYMRAGPVRRGLNRRSIKTFVVSGVDSRKDIATIQNKTRRDEPEQRRHNDRSHSDYGGYIDNAMRRWDASSPLRKYDHAPIVTNCFLCINTKLRFFLNKLKTILFPLFVE